MSVDLPATERVMADLQRRVLALETVQRVGINRVVTSYGTASVSPTTFGADEYGAVGTTWGSSTGSSGTGYPTVSIVLTAAALILVNGRVSELAEDAVYFRARSLVVGVNVDGGTLGTGADPDIRRQITNRNPGAISFPFSIAVMKSFTPGTHVFRVGAQWEDFAPAAPIQPLLSDVTLTVIPID